MRPGDVLMHSGIVRVVRDLKAWGNGLAYTVHFEDHESLSWARLMRVEILHRPTPQFGVIMADPPWSFNDTGSRIAPDSTRADDKAAAGYATATHAEICGLQVSQVARPDAVLFMWSTWTHVLNGEAAAVANAWGFTPKVAIPWIKCSLGKSASRAAYASHPAVSLAYRVGLRLQIAAGHYVRGISEPLIVCTRKGTPTVEPALRLPGVIFAPRGQHSRKPPAARAMVETSYPDHGPRLEMFCRGEHPGGWHAFGFEAEGELVLPSLVRAS